MRWKLLFAILFLAAGLALAGYSEYCFGRSGPSPVSISVPNPPVHITRKFLAYARARYRIGMALDESEKILPAKPDSTSDAQGGILARIEASWTISQGSRVI